jgi:hypothetical protein
MKFNDLEKKFLIRLVEKCIEEAEETRAQCFRLTPGVLDDSLQKAKDLLKRMKMEWEQ